MAALPDNEPSAFVDDLGSDHPDERDKQIAELQSRLDAEKDARKEDAFLWILGIIIIVDVVALGSMSNWSAPVVIGLLQLIGVVILADRLGVDTVAPLINRVTSAFSGAKE